MALWQFCSVPDAALLIAGIPFQPLLRSRLEGIPEEAARYFYGLRRFKRGVLSHVWFPAKAERRVRSSGSAFQPQSRRRQGETMLLALLDSLKRLVGGLSTDRRARTGQVSGTHSYDASSGGR